MFSNQLIIIDMIYRVSNKEAKGSSFTVLVPNIHQIRYVEGNRVAIVEIEGREDPHEQVDWLIYQETLQGWEPPYEMDELSPVKRAEILSRISESLHVLEMPHELVK